MRSNVPAPFGPVRRSGCRMRCGPCTNAVMSRATLLQMTPAVKGVASEPRTLVMRPSSTVTLRLHVSGQSKVQTLARSMTDMENPPGDAHYAGIGHSAVPITSTGARPSWMSKGGKSGIPTLRSDRQGGAGDRRQPRHRLRHGARGGRGRRRCGDLGHQRGEERRGTGRTRKDGPARRGAAMRCRRRGGG